MERILIEMDVRNHPGVMSHIAGLFSRRAVNIEEIAVIKGTDESSRMTLLVASNDRAMTVIRQLGDHYDVLRLEWREFKGDSIFAGTPYTSSSSPLNDSISLRISFFNRSSSACFLPVALFRLFWALTSFAWSFGGKPSTTNRPTPS